MMQNPKEGSSMNKFYKSIMCISLTSLSVVAPSLAFANNDISNIERALDTSMQGWKITVNAKSHYSQSHCTGSFLSKLKCEADYKLNPFNIYRGNNEYIGSQAFGMEVVTEQSVTGLCFGKQSAEILKAIEELKKDPLIETVDEKYRDIVIQFHNVWEDPTNALKQILIDRSHTQIDVDTCSADQPNCFETSLWGKSDCKITPSSKIIANFQKITRPSMKVEQKGIEVDVAVKDRFFKEGTNPQKNGEKLEVTDSDYLQKAMARRYLDQSITFPNSPTFEDGEIVKYSGESAYCSAKPDVMNYELSKANLFFSYGKTYKKKGGFYYEGYVYREGKEEKEYDHRLLTCYFPENENITIDRIYNIIPNAFYMKGESKRIQYLGVTEDESEAFVKINKQEKVVSVNKLMFSHSSKDDIETEQLYFLKSSNAIVKTVAMNVDGVKVLYKGKLVDKSFDDLLKFETSEIPVNETVLFKESTESKIKVYVKGQALIDGEKKILIQKNNELLFVSRNDLVLMKK
jgi:hypothetical protein